MGNQSDPNGYSGVFCPLCGIANPSQAVTCIACRSNVDVFNQSVSDPGAPECSWCGGSTPSLPTGRIAYCMHCGKPLRAALTTLPATPDPDLCPLCHQKGISVQTISRGAAHELAKELAPPSKPLHLRLFGTGGGSASDGLSRPAARRKITALSSVATVAARTYTSIVWILGGLTIVLLLVAMRKAGSYQDLLSAAQHGASVGAVISAHTAASVPYLLDACETLAAAIGLVAIKVTVEHLWQGPVIAYQRALKNWNSAYYCPTDRIVFIRTVTAVCWDPVEELHRLISKDRS